MAFAFLWTRYATRDGWSWVRQFGTTSLLVYWVHIELVYGRWLWFWKTALDVRADGGGGGRPDCVMLALSTAKTNRKRIAAWIGEMGWRPAPRPDARAGD